MELKESGVKVFDTKLQWYYLILSDIILYVYVSVLSVMCRWLQRVVMLRSSNNTMNRSEIQNLFIYTFSLLDDNKSIKYLLYLLNNICTHSKPTIVCIL